MWKLLTILFIFQLIGIKSFASIHHSELSNIEASNNSFSSEIPHSDSSESESTQNKCDSCFLCQINLTLFVIPKLSAYVTTASVTHYLPSHFLKQAHDFGWSFGPFEPPRA